MQHCSTCLGVNNHHDFLQIVALCLLFAVATAFDTYGYAPMMYGGADVRTAFPTYESVGHSVDIAAEPVEQWGYTIKY